MDLVIGVDGMACYNTRWLFLMLRGASSGFCEGPPGSGVAEKLISVVLRGGESFFLEGR